MIVLLVSCLLLVLILMRVPVAFSILASGIVGLLILEGPNAVIGSLETLPNSAIAKNALAAIPLFILMAQFVLHSGALSNLFNSARIIIGRIPGGTGYAAIGAGAVFASVSGSSTAAAATLAHTSTAQLIKQGYSEKLSAGTVAAAGTLAAMIPPSVLLVFYAITADTPVGETLVAGFVPGILVAIALCLTIAVVVATQRGSAPRGEATSIGAKIKALGGMLPIAILFVVVVGLVFIGVTTATEAAALGALGAFVMMVIYRKLTWANFNDSLSETVASSIMILFIILSAHVFGHFIVESGVTPKITGFLANLPIPPAIIVALIAAGYLLLGFFMDQMAIIALTVPVTLPVVEALGFDPIWFGIVVIVLAEIGLITPPLGLNVFVVSKAVKLPVERVFAGTIPFVLAILIVGVVLFLFPGLVLFLPGLMGS